MLQPIENPPTSWQPRFAASIIPGPPPVITAKPASATLRPIVCASSYIGSPGGVRAEPKIVTAGPTEASASKPSTNSARIRSARHGSVSRNSGRGCRSRSFSSSVRPRSPSSSSVAFGRIVSRPLRRGSGWPRPPGDGAAACAASASVPVEPSEAAPASGSAFACSSRAVVDRSVTGRRWPKSRVLRPPRPRRFVAPGCHLVAVPRQRQLQKSVFGEQPLDDLGVVHPQVRESLVPIRPARLVDERAGAEPIDEPSKLTHRDRPARQVHERNRDPALLEESDSVPGWLRTGKAEQLDGRGFRTRHRRGEQRGRGGGRFALPPWAGGL